MITLKDYQVRVLDSLREFLRLCAKAGNPAEAFRVVQVRNGRPPSPYLPIPLPGPAKGAPAVGVGGLSASGPPECFRIEHREHRGFDDAGSNH